MVMAIITLLSSVILSTVMNTRVRARDAARIDTMHQLAVALTQHEMTTGTYRVAGAGYQNTGSGLIAKSGTAEYPSSIISALKTSGTFSRAELRDPLWKDEGYYLGVCATSTKYDLFTKVERTESAHASTTITGACEGASALALGFNYVLGAGAGAGAGVAAGDGGSGGAGGGTANVWTPENMPNGYYRWSIAYGGGTYVAMVHASEYDWDLGATVERAYVSTRTDGSSWSVPQVVGCGRYNTIAYGAGQFVAFPVRDWSGQCPDKVLTSSNGATWTKSDPPTYGGNYYAPDNLLFTGSKFFGSSNGIIMISSDGNNWDFSGGEMPLKGIAYGNGKYIGVGGSEAYGWQLTSTDGVNWTQDYSLPAHRWTSIAYGNGKFMAVAEDGAVMTSPDASSWQVVLPPNSHYWMRIVFGNGIFAAADSTNGYDVSAVFFSTDGVTWTSPYDAGGYVYAFEYAGTRFFQFGDIEMVSSQN
jgi:type II secretory pathway pseudopilin PulG